MRTETQHSIILVAGTGTATLLGLVYSVYAQRMLGPVQAADFVAALALVAWCQLALGPINGTVARFTAQYADRRQHNKIHALRQKVARNAALYMLIGVGVVLLVANKLAALLQFHSAVLVVVACGMVYFALLLSVSRGVLRGLQAFGQLNLNAILEAAVRLVVGLMILEYSILATSGLAAYLVALVITLTVSQFQVDRLLRARDSTGVRATDENPLLSRGDGAFGARDQAHSGSIDGRAVSHYAGRMFFMLTVSAGFQNVDMLFVKHYLPGTDAGAYGAAFILARSMGAIVTPFTILMLPLLTTLHEQGRAIVHSFLRISGYFVLVAAVPVVLFFLWSDEMISWLYGEEFGGAGSVLPVLTVARLFGYLAHMVALAGAATNTFRFMYLYAPALVVQGVALVIWHESLAQVAMVMLLGHAGTLVLLASGAALAWRLGAGRTPGPGVA
ncbi:MAG: oligosaccharide flippase family protein [Phycisphaerae bacterium]